MLLGLYTADQNNALARASAAPAAELAPAFSESFGAAFAEARAFGNSDALWRGRHDAVQQALDAFEDATGEALQNPEAAAPGPNRDALERHNQARFEQIAGERPDLKLSYPSDEQRQQTAVERAQQARGDAARLDARPGTFASGAGGVIGGIAGAMTDPLNIASMFMGAGAASGILRTAAIEAGLAAGSQAVIEAGTAPFKQQVDPKWGLGDAAESIAMAGAGGAVIGGGLKALGTGISHLRGRPSSAAVEGARVAAGGIAEQLDEAAAGRLGAGDYDGAAGLAAAARAAREAIDRGQPVPREVRDALNVLERDAEVRASNPLGDSVAAEQAHVEALKKAATDMDAGQPVDVADIVQPAREEARAGADLDSWKLPPIPDEVQSAAGRWRDAPAKPAEALQDGDVVPSGGLLLKHGSPRADMSLDDIAIIRTGQKQGKKGRVYGGFYATSAADVEQARGYANMSGADGTVYDVIVAPGTRVLHKEGDITRLSGNQIGQWKEDGIGLVVGKDPRGRTEYVVIDKAAITEFKPEARAAAPPSPTSAPRPANDVTGPPRVYTPSGRAVDVEYRVVEADALVSSHGADGTVNPEFPADLQPRDRTRLASQTQIAEMASHLQPERLGRSPDAATGAPIVGPDMAVESGNGRVGAIRRAYEEGGDAAARYREWVLAQDPAAEGLRNPVLVAVRRTEMDPTTRSAFARDANAASAARMSPTELALADARRLDDAALNRLTSGDVTAAGNRAFVRAFLDRLPPSERGSLVDAAGALNQDGRKRLEGALLGRAYGDAAIIGRIVEDADTDIRAIGGALLDVAGPWAKLRAAVARGEIEAGMDVTADLLATVRMVAEARAGGRAVSELAQQMGLFGDDLTPTGRMLLAGMFRDEALTKPAGRARVAEMLEGFLGEAQKNTAGPRLFGEPLNAEQILSGERLLSETPRPANDLARPAAEVAASKEAGDALFHDLNRVMAFQNPEIHVGEAIDPETGRPVGVKRTAMDLMDEADRDLADIEHMAACVFGVAAE